MIERSTLMTPPVWNSTGGTRRENYIVVSCRGRTISKRETKRPKLLRSTVCRDVSVLYFTLDGCWTHLKLHPRRGQLGDYSWVRTGCETPEFILWIYSTPSVNWVSMTLYYWHTTKLTVQAPLNNVSHFYSSFIVHISIVHWTDDEEWVS